MAFKAGDLLKFKEDSWWTQRDRVFRNTGSLASYVLVTDSLESSERFFYGLVCGTGETHLWSQDQFDMVSKVSQ
tara:strand:- start:208 stop:429 length:222 start_codon:yes stop_codon:yes gene_type:complete